MGYLPVGLARVVVADPHYSILVPLPERGRSGIHVPRERNIMPRKPVAGRAICPICPRAHLEDILAGSEWRLFLLAVNSCMQRNTDNRRLHGERLVRHCYWRRAQMKIEKARHNHGNDAQDEADDQLPASAAIFRHLASLLGCLAPRWDAANVLMGYWVRIRARASVWM